MEFSPSLDRLPGAKGTGSDDEDILAASELKVV